MKKAVTFSAVVILLMVSLLSPGCGSPEVSGLEAMMKRMPDSTSDFYFQNVKEGRVIGAAELCKGYGRNIGMWRENPLDIIITPDETDYLAWFISDWLVSLIEGNFNLDSIREKLAESDMNNDQYRGVEIWREEDRRDVTGYESDLVHALVNDRLILIGYEPGVNDCIDVMNGGQASLWENRDFGGIIERLPEGLTMNCRLDWGREVEDIVVGGFSLVMNEDGTQDFTFVGKFRSSDAAGKGIDIILNDLADDFGFSPVSAAATQDGEYITIIAEGQEIY